MMTSASSGGPKATAFTVAMMRLKGHGVLALPMHDGLIVPASAEELAKTALVSGYSGVARVAPSLAVARAAPRD